MIGQYVNTGRGRRVTITPAVPGAQCRITAWALSKGRRSATPAVVDATTGEASKCPIALIACSCCIVYTVYDLTFAGLNLLLPLEKQVSQARYVNLCTIHYYYTILFIIYVGMVAVVCSIYIYCT